MIKKRFFDYSLIVFIAAVAKFLVTPIIANNSSDLGNWDYLINLFIFFEVILTLRISSSSYRFYGQYFMKDSAIINISFFIIFIASVLFTLFLYYAFNINLSIYIIFLFFFSRSINLLFNEIFRAKGFININKNLVFLQSLIFLILIYFFKDNLTLNIIVISSILSSLPGIFFLIRFIRINKIILYRDGRKLLMISKKMLTYSIPLALSSVGWIGIKSLNRIFIDIEYGASGLNIYAMAFFVPTIFFMLGTIAFTTIQDISIHKKKTINNYFDNAVFFNFLLFVSLYFFSFNINSFLFSNNSNEITVITKILLSAAFFHNLSSCQSVIFLKGKKTIQLLIGNLFGLFIAILFFIFCYYKGFDVLINSALFVFVGYFSSFIYRLLLQNNIIKFNINFISIILISFVFLCFIYEII